MPVWSLRGAGDGCCQAQTELAEHLGQGGSFFCAPSVPVVTGNGLVLHHVVAVVIDEVLQFISGRGIEFGAGRRIADCFTERLESGGLKQECREGVGDVGRFDQVGQAGQPTGLVADHGAHEILSFP